MSAARVSVLEKDEMRGAITLKIMQKAAKAMGCRFEYQIDPLTDEAAITDNGNLYDKANIQSASSKPKYRVVAK